MYLFLQSKNKETVKFNIISLGDFGFECLLIILIGFHLFYIYNFFSAPLIVKDEKYPFQNFAGGHSYETTHLIF